VKTRVSKFAFSNVLTCGAYALDTVVQVQAMTAASKELKTQFKSKEFNIDAIDALNDEMADLMDYSNEIQETMGRNYNIPDDIDEDELLGREGLVVTPLPGFHSIPGGCQIGYMDRYCSFHQLNRVLLQNNVVKSDAKITLLIGELDALEESMALEEAGEEVPSYLQDEALPDAPDGVVEPLPAAGTGGLHAQAEGMPAEPQRNTAS
jgi:hypothetical protein